jgi:hypothetical protein
MVRRLLSMRLIEQCIISQFESHQNVPVLLLLGLKIKLPLISWKGWKLTKAMPKLAHI